MEEIKDYIEILNAKIKTLWDRYYDEGDDAAHDKALATEIICATFEDFVRDTDKLNREFPELMEEYNIYI